MGLRDVLLGRTRSVAPNLDNLFALPQAAITLEASLDLTSSGQAGLCFKASSGEAALDSDQEMLSLVRHDANDDSVSLTTDSLGFHWLTMTDPDLASLVTKVHAANTTLVEHGLGTRLLCAVFGFVPRTPLGEGAVRLVYLEKQGTFYPFAPTGPQDRNNELEIRVQSFVSGDLPMEKDLSRWMAIWDVPVH